MKKMTSAFKLIPMVIPSKYLTPLLEIEWFDRRKLFGNPSTNLESPNAWSRYGFERHNKQICFATSEEAGHGGPSSIIPLQNILFCGMLISLKSTSHLLTALFQQRATTKIKENPTSVFANQGSSGIRTPSASNFPFTYAYTNVSSSSPRI
ncbi:uncharacterized protein LOC108208006 isoform X3 [Daucus carota subsp. sativus]|uniref:uncharacterized protein LOC108208788 isoform X3 n=1 Tax=Daucus carota subsp. sativus TaxID=79200 RepID=UPI0030836803